MDWDSRYISEKEPIRTHLEWEGYGNSKWGRENHYFKTYRLSEPIGQITHITTHVAPEEELGGKKGHFWSRAVGLLRPYLEKSKELHEKAETNPFFSDPDDPTGPYGNYGQTDLQADMTDETAQDGLKGSHVRDNHLHEEALQRGIRYLRGEDL